MKQKTIAILGSTGSIGTQALEVIREHADKFSVSVLTAQNNCDLLIEQAIEFKPNSVVIANADHYQKVKNALNGLNINVLAGNDCLVEVMQIPETDIVLTAMVGISGLKPTLAAIAARKNIALANKETLVVAGSLVTEKAAKNNVQLLPVDSEHSAIFQCLIGEEKSSIEKIILTASGGPFRGKNRNELANITKAQALKHPNWIMGAKITIDSATLMNKGLEVIEAKWLFDVEAKDIEVLVHPQSVIHSMVQFIDGSVKAQLGIPDMKLPIQYALAYPNRIASAAPRLDFATYPNLTFDLPDIQTFRNLALCYEALEKGGTMPCILNAANEIVVAAFLQDQIGFLEMTDVIAECMQKVSFVSSPNFDDFFNTDNETRLIASEMIKQFT